MDIKNITNHELYNNIRNQFHKEEAKLLLINPYMEPNDLCGTWWCDHCNTTIEPCKGE